MTNTGRAIGFVLMVGGIGFFGALTANLASFLIREDTPQQATLSRLLTEMESLRRELAESRGTKGERGR